MVQSELERRAADADASYVSTEYGARCGGGGWRRVMLYGLCDSWLAATQVHCRIQREIVRGLGENNYSGLI